MSQEYDRVFVWGNDPRRAELYGRLCRVLATGTSRNSVLVEFRNGERVVASRRSLRRKSRYEGKIRDEPEDRPVPRNAGGDKL